MSLLLAAPAQAQAPVPAAPHVVDGPSAAIMGLSQLAVARDGTGGLVYLKQVSGAAHVFVSRLAGGAFQPPEQIDAGLAGASSQPVIAAAGGGLLVIGFVSGGQLYAVQRPAGSSSYSAPLSLATGRNPAIAITTVGKAYLAFTAPGAGGGDVRSAYYHNGSWSLESAPLDADPGDDSGSGSGRPAVAAAGDGVGVVAWGEAGHVYTRRVWGTSPSVVFEQADVPSLAGWSESGADEPQVASGGDSSYAAVAFHEILANGSQTQSRVLMRRLVASSFQPPLAADGLSTPGAEGADQPQVVVAEYGEGLVTASRSSSHQVVAMGLDNNAVPGPVQRVDTLQNAGLPYAVPGTAGYHDAFVAWQQDSGVPGGTEIHLRYYEEGAFDPEQVVSTPTRGPTDAADGIDAAGDIASDVAVAWVQGSSGSKAIVAAQLYQPPGQFKARPGFGFARAGLAQFSWSRPHEPWGPVAYTVTVDGRTVAQSTTTSVLVPSAQLAQGPHVWTVTATNPAGLTSVARAAEVFVDTIAPVLQAKLSGSRLAGKPIQLRLAYTDAPAPVPRADTSGIKEARISWGDGSSARGHRRQQHDYGRPGRYRILVTVSDRAGNRTRVRLELTIRGGGSGHRKGKR